jgi:chorismate mutase
MENESLDLIRKEISKVDSELIKLLIRRFHYSYVIGKYKKEDGIPIVDESVKSKVLDKYSKGLGVYGESIYNLLHEISVKIQEHETNDI